MDQHLPNLFSLLDKYNLLELLCFHSAHKHFSLPSGTVLCGVDGKPPTYYRRAKPTRIEDIFQTPIHGYIFVVWNSELRAYEFQDGKAHDWSGHNLQQFLKDFVSYVERNKIQSHIGLQIRDKGVDRPVTFEYFDGNESIMLDEPRAKEMGYEPGRTTGWVGIKEDGDIRIHGNTHHIVHEGQKKCYIDQTTPLKLVS